MIEVVLKKHRKVIEKKVYSDAQFLHQVKYRLLPGEKGQGIWAELLLDKALVVEKRSRHLVRIADGVLVLRYIG